MYNKWKYILLVGLIFSFPSVVSATTCPTGGSVSISSDCTFTPGEYNYDSFTVEQYTTVHINNDPSAAGPNSESNSQLTCGSGDWGSDSDAKVCNLGKGISYGGDDAYREYGVKITSNSDITINGRIDAQGEGYSPAPVHGVGSFEGAVYTFGPTSSFDLSSPYNVEGFGPNCNDGGDGGGYGGHGGESGYWEDGPWYGMPASNGGGTYQDSVEATRVGSGGAPGGGSCGGGTLGGAGGGSVWFVSSGDFYLSGTIDVDGVKGRDNDSYNDDYGQRGAGGGGSGGSVRIEAGNLYGSGNIYARGGDGGIGTESGGGGGGGGRIYVSGIGSPSWNFYLSGGTGGYALDGGGTDAKNGNRGVLTKDYNAAPDAPSNPSPYNGESNVGTSPTLSVDVSDPNGDNMDVMFYNANNGNLIGTDYSVCSGCTASVSWSGLNYDSNYDWYAVADDSSASTQSNTWSFNTEPGINPPSNPSPSDGANLQPETLSLSVDVSDPQGDSMDVSFYNQNNGNLIGTDSGVASGGTASVTWSGLSSGSTYDWYAVADDGSNTASSSTYRFYTAQSPDSPFNPSPSDGAQSIPTGSDLQVDATHPDGLEMSVDFYIDDGSGYTYVATDPGVTDGSSATANPNLDSNQDYEWYAVASAKGFTQQSSSWTFSTNKPPEILRINKSDADFGHSFSEVRAYVRETSGASDISSSELTVSDGDGNSNTYTGTIETSYGNSSEAVVKFYDVSASDMAGWEDTETVNLEVSVTDSGGLTTTDSILRSFPNHAPSAVDLQPSGGEVQYGPTLNATYDDPDGDSGNLTFYNTSSGNQIGKVTDLAPGEHGTVEWSSADTPGTAYNFTVKAFDGLNSTNTTENFTTIYEPKAPYDPNPENESTVDTTTRTDDEIAASVKVVHPDDRPMNVEFINRSNGQIMEIDYNVESGTRAKITNNGNSLRDETNETYNWYARSYDTGTGEYTDSSPFAFHTVEVGDVMFDVMQGENGDNMDVTGDSNNGWTSIEFEITSSQMDPIPTVTVNETSTGDLIKSWTDVENNSVLSVNLEQDNSPDWNLDIDSEYEYFIEAKEGPNVVGQSLNHTIYTYNVSLDWDRAERYYDVYQYDVYRAQDTGSNLIFDYGSGDYDMIGSLPETSFNDSGPGLETGTFCWKVAASNPSGSSDAIPIGDGECRTLN